MLDRQHFSAITASTQAVLDTYRTFMDASADCTDDPFSNDRYFALECSLGELRRRLASAGCFKLRHKLFPTAKETAAYAALRTLAGLVGENSKGPESASGNPQGSPLAAIALDPRKRNAYSAKLAAMVKVLDDFLQCPSLRERVLAVLTKQQQAIMEHLWERRTATYDTLRTVPGAFQAAVTDEAVEVVVKRINARLTEAGLPVVLHRAGGRVNLELPGELS